MATLQRKLVHKQFNSPIGLYSQDNVKETLQRELKAFGSDGIEIDDQVSRPLNLANSEVLRAVEEEEQMKCEPVKSERQSRSRQRIYLRPPTPVHQQQLEQIKTQYLSHQHDVTIDRDTVLKINRLATRRNLHKREHSWPPTTNENATTSDDKFNNDDRNARILSHQQHIRSTSIDNALQFDQNVCKRHGIDVIREVFNSPTRIIEPTVQEVKRRREQQRHLQHQQQQQQQKQKRHAQENLQHQKECVEVSGEAVHGVTTNKHKQMVNLLKHEELLRKNSANKSTTMTDTTIAERANEKNDLRKIISLSGQQSAVMATEKECDKQTPGEVLEEDELFPTTTMPIAKGFSHPETKAADEDIGLVEPKRQFYEQLHSNKKWHSFENLNSSANVKTAAGLSTQQPNKRQSHSLERSREVRQHKDLPPQKPRNSPRMQRRCMKLATELKISYDNDAHQHNIQVKSLNPPNNSITNAFSNTDLEHIPLPAIPGTIQKVPLRGEQSDKQKCDVKSKYFKEQQIYDDSCIFLRSVDLQDNTVAYIPAAITIVPSPTDELMQHWVESNSLKANIKGVNDIETAANATNDLQNKNTNLISHLEHDAVKSVSIPEGIKPPHITEAQQQQQQRNDMLNSENATYVTRLPTIPNGIQHTCQTSANTKHATHMNNNAEDGKNSTNLELTSRPTKKVSLQQTGPPEAIHANATSSESNKVAKRGDITVKPGDYYTDGEYVYGPYDAHSGAPLASTTVRSLQAEQQAKRAQELQQQQAEIKKDTEAETKTQHNTEISSLAAKYENMQKSINEHLRQIDAYIGNVKVALKSTLATGNKPDSSASYGLQTPTQTQLPHNLAENSSKAQLAQTQQEEFQSESPLKEILRNITNIMHEVKPLCRNEEARQETCMPPAFIGTTQHNEEGNMAIVDKVLIDLNMLTKHLSEFDKSSSEEPKPIIEQLDLQFETRPTSSATSHALTNEDTATKEILMETGKHHQKSETVKSTQLPLPPTPAPAPAPPPLPLRTSASAPMAPKEPMQENQIQRDAGKQLLATDKLIKAKTQTQQDSQQQQQQQLPHQQMIKGTTKMSAVVPKDRETTTGAAAAHKDKNKNFTSDFITARHQQEELVQKVIDTLEKSESELQEKLVNTHVLAHDEQIKSNLNQQTPSSSSQPSTAFEMTTTLTKKREGNVAIMQNCNISVSANTSGKDTCNHGSIAKSTKGNESQLKLHIKDFADKKPDEQFRKYDNPHTENTNDMANDNKSNQNQCAFGQEHQHHNKYSSTEYHYDANHDKNGKFKEGEEERADSNHSSGSELSNTNKSSYELPSPYITTRQIAWEDVLAAVKTQKSTNLLETQQRSGKQTKSVNIFRPKHEMEAAQISTENAIMLNETEPAATTTTTSTLTLTASGLQSQPHKRTRQQQQEPQIEVKQNHQQYRGQMTVAGQKYHTSLNEPHLMKRSTSPFASADMTLPFKPRSSSVSPSRLQTQIIAKDATTATAGRHELMEAIRKYQSSLAETHAPPCALNAHKIKNIKSSTSTSPKHYNNSYRTSPGTVDEMAIRKYPAPLAEPHVPSRAASPFGLNPVDVFQIMLRDTTPLSACENDQVKRGNEKEQEYYYEHVDKPASPVRKYPPSLIEPHVPTRAASPFGLNPVDLAENPRQCTASPHHHHHRLYEAKLSTTRDSHKTAVVYVPQVEGHNIGLLVRTTTPTPYRRTDTTHASAVHSKEIINATNTTCHYATATNRDITDNKYCATNDIGRAGEDDDATCDELQRINTIGLTKQAEQPKMHNLHTTGTTATTTTTTIATNETMSRHQHQHQHHQAQEQERQLQHDGHQLQNQEQYSGCSGHYFAVDTTSLPTSVINRTFDNVSPRPYITIEGYKRVAWPPVSEERIVREFTPQPQTQYQPAPAYNQQYQPSAAHAASAVPQTQGPIYNNMQQNTNNFTRANNSPFKQDPNENDCEAFPPQTPETPIILKDKQFSRLPSQEPCQTNPVSAQQYKQSYYQSLQQSDFKQPLCNQENYQQQQYQYQANQQSTAQNQHQQQQYQMPEEHHRHPHHSGRQPKGPHDHYIAGRNTDGATTPFTAPVQQQYQNYHQSQSAAPQQPCRAPSYDNYQQQNPPQPQYQQPPQVGAYYQQPAQQQQQQHPPLPQYQQPQPPQVGSYYQQPAQQPAWAQQKPNQQQAQQQYQAPPWVQQAQQQPQQQQNQYPNSLNQYNQTPHYQQQQKPQTFQSQPNQFVPKTNQQFNSYSQPQQQQHTVSHDQVDQYQHPQAAHLAQDQRGASPGIITLRKEVPITQKPAAVYNSQPAAISYRGGSNMRGDLKWPPPEYKEAAAKENEERRNLALGPVCRPRKVHRDYTTFFAKNALSHHYPSYKVPPGTQHMVN